ncbi:unnamed protein product [Adineta ricciae]|uniref:Methyltransferase type 11 domain-containing protein n=1 Tax=Adineta ricciae TaxID=249248 RepID=A0A815ANR6_ADIRI|nr:unnamed protein product [Adineta ricciae]
MSLYRVSPIPLDHVEVFRQQSDPPTIPSNPSYGIDAPLGLIASSFAAPLYLYATLSGKFQIVDEIRTKTNQPISPVYGIDIFNSFDQTSNSPLSTCRNVASANLLDYVILNIGSFLDLPFKDNSFTLVTSSLAIHNVSNTNEKQRAIRECARVTKPAGWLLIVDLKGNVSLYENTLKELQWNSIERTWAGMKMMFGVWPCEVLKAQKPFS